MVAEVCGVRAAVSITQEYPTLTELARADVAELRLLENVGGTHARRIKAALELSSRLSREVLGESPILDTPDKIADLLREDVRPYTVETLQVVLLNTRRRLIRVVPVSNGTSDPILVHAREVFRHAIAMGASAIILAHNLCVAAHKLCYVTPQFMCSARLTVLTQAWFPWREECYA